MMSQSYGEYLHVDRVMWFGVDGSQRLATVVDLWSAVGNRDWKIIETEGGTIRLDSKLGTGTTFYFTWLQKSSQPNERIKSNLALYSYFNKIF
ncbi:hypothetical protein [Chamaesiphon sp.]|uniref:hypothetical protein n=1 Tax=Chamaesiphon sp. TaxID=2814140 RepID=UPI003593EEF0